MSNTSKDRFRIFAAVFLIIKSGDKVLLMRRANTGWHDGSYDLPCGHLEGGEASTTATCREAKEELGITIDPTNLKLEVLSHGLYEDGKEYYNLFFSAEQWKGTPQIMEPDKCDDLQWCDIDQLPEALTPNTQLGLYAVRDGQSYVEIGF